MLKLISNAQESIAEYERAQRGLANVLLEAGHIVVCQEVYLTFDVDQAGNVLHPRSCEPHLARRFTKEHAEQVAASVVNGNGINGEAMHVTDAIAGALDAQRAVLELVLSFQAKQAEASTCH